MKLKPYENLTRAPQRDAPHQMEFYCDTHNNETDFCLKNNLFPLITYRHHINNPKNNTMENRLLSM